MEYLQQKKKKMAIKSVYVYVRMYVCVYECVHKFLSLIFINKYRKHTHNHTKKVIIAITLLTTATFQLKLNHIFFIIPFITYTNIKPTYDKTYTQTNKHTYTHTHTNT